MKNSWVLWLLGCGHIHRCSTDISTMNPIILVGIHNLEFHLRVNNFHAQISQWVQVGHPLRMNEINSVLWLYDVCILNCGMFTVVLWNSKSKIQTSKFWNFEGEKFPHADFSMGSSWSHKAAWFESEFRASHIATLWVIFSQKFCTAWGHFYASTPKRD